MSTVGFVPNTLSKKRSPIKTRKRSNRNQVEGLRNAVRKLQDRQLLLDRQLRDIRDREDDDARARRLALLSKLHRVSLKLDRALSKLNKLFIRSEV